MVPTPVPDAPPTRLWTLPRNVWVVTLTSFLTDVSSEMLFTLLPLFLSNVLGARTNVIGLIEGVAETTSSLVKVGSGWLSDRLGHRKWLAVGGYALSAVSKPVSSILKSIAHSCDSCAANASGSNSDMSPILLSARARAVF